MGCACTRDQKIILNSRMQPLLKGSNSVINNQVQSTMINSAKVISNGDISLSNKKEKPDCFKISIVLHNNINKEIMYPLTQNQEYALLIDLLNKSLFNSSEFHFNFVSKYNKQKDIFEYNIESIKLLDNKNDEYSKSNTIKAGVQRNKYWSIYINNNQEDLNSIVDKGRVVNKNDNIELREQEVNI